MHFHGKDAVECWWPQPMMVPGLPGSGWGALWWIYSKHKQTPSQISFTFPCGFIPFYPLPVWREEASQLHPRLPFSFWVFQGMILFNGQGVLPLCCLLYSFLLPHFATSDPSVIPVSMFPHVSIFKALHVQF